MKPSRAMITGELSWAFVALCFAWGGSGLWPFEGSRLAMTLKVGDYDDLWVALMAIPAIGLMWLSVVEHFRHSRDQCDVETMNKSAFERGRLCLVLAFSWGYVAYTLIKIFDRPSILVMIALGGVVFCLWFWVENRRVQREYRKLNVTLAP